MEQRAVRDDRAADVPDAGARGARGTGPPDAAVVAEGLLAYIERSANAVAIVDGRSLAIRYANAAFERVARRRVEPGTIQELADVLPAEAAAAILDVVQELPAAGAAPRQVEIASGRSGPGVADWAVAVSFATRGRDTAPDLVLEIRDITEERRAQRETAELLDQLREVNRRLLDSSLREAELAERAEVANAAKSTFLATMSHELRTPLTAIIGYGDLLADGLFGPVTAEQQRHLGRIKLSAKHLLGLIDQILTLARMEAGQEPVVLEDVAIGEIVEWITTIVEPLARMKGLSFVAEAPPTVLETCVHTDTTKLRQVLVNLIGNAVKFTERGLVALTVSRDDDLVVFRVRDTGIGIAEQDLDRVFEPFWQVEQRPTRTAGGSGLGLDVSRRLARLLGGEVTVDSVLGAGSTFTLSLPVRAA